MELTEDELDCVVGGWWSDNWKRVVETAVTAVLAGTFGAAVGMIGGAAVGGPVGAVIGALVGGAAAGGLAGWGMWRWTDPNYTPSGGDDPSELII